MYKLYHMRKNLKRKLDCSISKVEHVKGQAIHQETTANELETMLEKRTYSLKSDRNN